MLKQPPHALPMVETPARRPSPDREDDATKGTDGRPSP
jgi:hypothetical protein